MESRSFKTLKLLEAIAEEKPLSQRQLSDELQISLGLVNSFIKRLVKKGYCKVTTIPPKRVKYLLTPAGAVEKTRLTYEYIATSYQYFKSATQKVHELYADLQKEGHTRVVFYGADELSEIAYHAMTGTNIELAAVVDSKRKGVKLYGFNVEDISALKKTDFDILLITTIDNHEAILGKITATGVQLDKVRFF